MVSRRVLQRKSSNFNELLVRQVGLRVDLDVAGATFATWHPERVLTGYSWDALAAACCLRPDGPPRSVLLLGLGGGTVARQLRALWHDVQLVGVEIDEAVLALSRSYLHLDDAAVEVIHDDAMAFVSRCTRKFDVVVDDLFLTGPEDVQRAAVVEGSFLTALTRLIAPGGLLVANLIVDEGHHAVRRQTRAAFASHFHDVMTVRPPRGLNEVLIGAERIAPPRTLTPYTEKFRHPSDRKAWAQLELARLRKRPL